MRRRSLVFCGFLFFLSFGQILARAQSITLHPRRNIIIFVADGMRRGSVNEQSTPALWKIRTQGVDLQDSHSVYPTLTTSNASAIATGHDLGDTGGFSNVIWLHYAKFDTHNFNQSSGSSIPFLEDDQVLADLDEHFGGDFLGEETLLSLARAQGYNTVAIGKAGPVAIQDASAISPSGRRFPPFPATVIVDDSTGSGAGLALPPQLGALLLREGLPLEAPARTNGYAADSPYNNGNSAGTLRANATQQQWFADVATKAVLPLLAQDSGKPFAMLFWSRDPDASQHNEGDSSGTLFPGINGPTSELGVQNADRNLQQLLDWLDANPAVKANTDIFVTSDHGFATVSRREIDRFGHSTSSEAANHYYLDANGNVQTIKGTLPDGFLAIDLAVGLGTNLFDPDTLAPAGSRLPYKQVRLAYDVWEHPASGNGFLGNAVEKLDGSDARAIVAANGGSDLIYVPDDNPETVRAIVHLLFTFDYVGGVFVDSKYGEIPGALHLKDIGFEGTSRVPRPAIVVAFKVFNRLPGDLQTAVQVADTTSQEGQGNHGGFGRDSTWNNMAAMGPDFKSGFADPLPVGNEDIMPTLASVMGLKIPASGSLQGRVINETLKDGVDPPAVPERTTVSTPENGLRTILLYQEYAGHRYLDSACVAPQNAQPETACH